MNHSQQYRQAYAQLRREGLDPRAAMAQAGATVGFPGVPQPQPQVVAVVPTPHIIPQFVSLLRERRQEAAADDRAVEHLVLDTSFDTDDEIEYGLVDDYSVQGRSFFGGVGLSQYREAKLALVREGCVGLENAYVCDPDGGSPDPNYYVDYCDCGEPFASTHRKKYGYFAQLLRESACTEFVYRMHPSTDRFDELVTSRLRDFGEGVFEMLVDLVRDIRHGHMPVTSALMFHAVELHLKSIGSAATELPEWTIGQDEEEWQDIHEGLQSYPGEPGCYDMFEHVPRWNRSPYRRRAHCARATALGIEDLDLRASTSPICSLLRLWPVLRLSDPGDGPTFETYASFSNRALDIFAKSARRWVGRFVVEESRNLRRRHAIRDVERQLPLPTPVCAHILEFSEG